MTPSNVLVFTADPLLVTVVGHLLPAERYGVWRCQSLDEIACLLDQGARLAVLDLPEVDAPTLAFIRQLHAQSGKPVLVLSDHPEQLAEELEPAIRLLSRPPQMNQLQAALNAALAEPGPTPGPSLDGPPPPGSGSVRHWLAGAVGLVVLAGLTLLFIGPMLGIPGIPNVLQWAVGKKEEKPPEPPLAVTLLPGQPDAFEVSATVANKMRIPKKPFTIARTPQPRTLTLSGTLAFDPDRLARIQSLFPGQVVALGTTNGKAVYDTRQTPFGILENGSVVKKDSLLAVVWSKDLGEKKSDLVDSLVQLSLDKETLKKLDEAASTGGIPDATLRAARTAVAKTIGQVNKAERALRTWKVSEEEIKAVKEEAKRIIDRKGKREPDREQAWARVEIHSPINGVIVEKNVQFKTIVDPTQNMFMVADLSWLAVYAHVYEEDQRDVQKELEKHKGGLLPWRLHLTADPGRLLSSPGLKRLGKIIDPAQHTGLAMGVVDNTSGEMNVGQFVTAEIDLPAPADVVSIPTAALEEDGEMSHVLVQLEPDRHRYALRRVRVVSRYQSFAYVRSKLSDSDRAAGLSPLNPGDLIVTGGAVQLKAALEEARSRSKVQK